MAPPLHVLIVGGGLGGLATAIALRQKNIKVTVLEGAQKLGEVGAGIQVKRPYSIIFCLSPCEGAPKLSATVTASWC